MWFYVHGKLAGSQEEAVALVTGWLRDQCGIVNDFAGFKPPEASDSQARLSRLQPWREATDLALNHAHDLHIRYYYVALRQTQHDRVAIEGRDALQGGLYYRFAGSVHYEVEDEHPLHPYVDSCPYCGRTGEFAQAEDLFAGVHEPLGLELLLSGTIRGRPVKRINGRPVGGIIAMNDSHRVEVHRLSPTRPDMNVVTLALVTINSPGFLSEPR